MASKKTYISPRPKLDGSSALYLQIIINRKKKNISIKIDWPAKFFDEKEGVCLPRRKNDPDVNDYNMIISDFHSKANEIFKYHRLSNQLLTMERFLKSWKNDLSKDNLVKYMEQKAKVRLKDKEIEYSTYQAHLKVIVKLKEWKDEILFLDLDHNWAESFDASLKKSIKTRRGNTTNTRWNHHKTIKAYLKIARKKDHISFVDPYEFFTINPIQGAWRPIYEKDLSKLYHYYKETDLNTHRWVLRRFLFSSFTGLRKSDLYRVEDRWLSGGIMRFIPYKNRKLGRILEIPLEGVALEMFNDALAEKGSGRLFDDLEEQSSNRILKEIATKLEIDANLHHHVGRHTFITLYLKNGGTLDMAQEYAGHADIKQTMKYNHIDEDRRRKEIKVMNDIIIPNQA